jgi:hypothetical protein
MALCLSSIFCCLLSSTVYLSQADLLGIEMLLLLFKHLFRRHRSKPAHHLQIFLLAHLLIALTYFRQDLKVVDVERGCEGVEKLCFFVRRVREGVWRADGYCYVVADVRVVVGTVRGMEAHHALGYEEGLVVHLVPVRWGTGGIWRESKLVSCQRMWLRMKIIGWGGVVPLRSLCGCLFSTRPP